MQATVLTGEAFDLWKKENPLPFTVGHVDGKNDRTRWAAETESLPWLMLVDGQGKVTAEGFALEDLGGKL